MNITSKPVLLSVPVVIVTALVVVLALWAMGMTGSGGAVLGGASSNAGLVWNVEYWHRNADGDLLFYKKDKNALTAVGKEIAMERLIKVGAGDITSTTAQLQEADAFDNIVLLNAVFGSFPITSGKILAAVDGSNGSGDCNPCDGDFTDGGGNGTGDGTVDVIFTASGAATTAEMHLVKAANQEASKSNIVAADVLATLPVVVTLANNDTLQIKWTIDVD